MARSLREAGRDLELPSMMCEDHADGLTGAVGADVHRHEGSKRCAAHVPPPLPVNGQAWGQKVTCAALLSFNSALRTPLKPEVTQTTVEDPAGILTDNDPRLALERVTFTFTDSELLI